jgi:hypothetical protein
VYPVQQHKTIKPAFSTTVAPTFPAQPQHGLPAQTMPTHTSYGLMWACR